MSDGPLEIDQPEWPAIIRALQAQVQEQIHTSLPGVVKSYDSVSQTATVQLAVQLSGRSVPELHDVPVAWPGGVAGFLHVPLAANDTVLVVFCEEDFARWYVSGSISAPGVLARHGLHAVAIPGVRPATASLAVTGGHATLGVASELRLGSDSASDPVALKSLVQSAMSAIWDGVIVAAGSVTSPGGGPAFVAALTTQKATFLATLQVGSSKVKSV